MKPREMIRKRLDEDGNSIVAVLLSWGAMAFIALVAWLVALGQENKEKRRNRSGGGAGRDGRDGRDGDDGDDGDDDFMDHRIIKQTGNNTLKEDTSSEIFDNVSDATLDNFINDGRQVKTVQQAIAFVRKYSSIITARVLALFKSSH
jgi:hypothetical protein